MKLHERIFRATLGLGMLPESARRWLFSSGTRALEVLNALCMLAWAVALLDEGMLAIPIYRVFVTVGGPWANWFSSITFASMFVLSVVGIVGSSIGARRLGGFVILCGGLAWACVAAAFIATYPPLNTAMVVYALLAVLCLLAGEHLIYESRLAHTAPEDGTHA